MHSWDQSATWPQLPFLSVPGHCLTSRALLLMLNHLGFFLREKKTAKGTRTSIKIMLVVLENKERKKETVRTLLWWWCHLVHVKRWKSCPLLEYMNTSSVGNMDREGKNSPVSSEEFFLRFVDFFSTRKMDFFLKNYSLNSSCSEGYKSKICRNTDSYIKRKSISHKYKP